MKKQSNFYCLDIETQHPHALLYFLQDPTTVAAIDKKLQKG